MRKWFEWQAQNQDSGDETEPANIKNLYRETECLRQYISEGTFERVDMDVFSGDFYMREFDQKYADAGLTREQIKEWVEDPAYHKLLRETGIVTYIPVPRKVTSEFLSQVKEFFPIDWGQTEIKVMLQGPGQMFPLHYDRYKSEMYSVDPDKENRVRRWMIMLEDQQLGQCLFMRNQSLSWRAGDVLAWEHSGVPHGSANFGYWPRYSVRITGPLIEK